MKNRKEAEKTLMPKRKHSCSRYGKTIEYLRNRVDIQLGKF